MFTCLPGVAVDMVLVVEVRVVQLSECSQLQFSFFVSPQVYQQRSTSGPHLGKRGGEQGRRKGGEGREGGKGSRGGGEGGEGREGKERRKG